MKCLKVRLCDIILDRLKLDFQVVNITNLPRAPFLEKTLRKLLLLSRTYSFRRMIKKNLAKQR